jgi:Leu/Phe-tRNA-protein transferase
MHTAHLERFGAREIARDDFLDRIRVLGQQDGLPGPWNFDPSCDVVQEV